MGAVPTVGEQVLFVPDEHHWHQTDAQGKPVWRFEQSPPASTGGPVGAAPAGKPRLLGPVAHWPATITAVHDDGTVDLDVKHPNGFETLHNHHRCHDPSGKTLGTWHRAEE